MPYTLQDEVVFCGGNFWQLQAHFARLPGVTSTVVGYAGGTTSHPNYHDIGDHIEAVQIAYDQRLITFVDLLSALLICVDVPAAEHRYARRILCVSADQRRQASRWLHEQRAADIDHIVVESLGRFWAAEEYHQNYLAKLRGDT